MEKQEEKKEDAKDNDHAGPATDEELKLGTTNWEKENLKQPKLDETMLAS